MPATSSAFKPITHRAANEIVYETVREAISSGEFSPGEKLSTRKTAEQLGVSQMPVREAFQRLVAEGALTKSGNRSISISEMSPEQFEELTEIRLILEGLAARKAAENASQSQKKTLAKLVQQLDQAFSNDDNAAHLSLNRKFHFLIYQASGSRELSELIENLWLRVGPLLRSNTQQLDSVIRAGHWHKHASTAIASGDGAAAEHAIQMDLREAADVIRQTF